MSYTYEHSKLFWKSYYLLCPVQKVWKTLTNFVITNNQITFKILILNIPLANYHLLILELTCSSLLLLDFLEDFQFTDSTTFYCTPTSPFTCSHPSLPVSDSRLYYFHHTFNSFALCYSVLFVKTPKATPNSPTALCHPPSCWMLLEKNTWLCRQVPH